MTFTTAVWACAGIWLLLFALAFIVLWAACAMAARCDDLDEQAGIARRS